VEPQAHQSEDRFVVETNRLIAERLPIGAIALLAVFAAAWVIEHRANPQRDWTYAAVYGCEILTLAAAILLSRLPRWRERSSVLTVVTVIALIFQVALYHVLVRGEGAVLNMALLYLVTGTMVLMPWGWQGQLPVAASTILAYGIAFAAGVQSATPLPMNFLGLGTIGALSVGGAAFLAHHRRALWEQTEALRAANTALAEANRVKNQFIANVSHELRTPLSIIIGYTDLLQEGGFGCLPADAHEPMERVARNARSLVRLVADLLDLARIEAGHLEVRLGSVELGPLFGEMALFVEPYLDGKDVRFRCELEDATRVTADRGSLEQILVNLLSNAAKFTEHGEIQLSAQRGADGTVTIAVRDTGAGIDAAELPRIFQPFGQGAVGKRLGGIGIGLSLSASLAHAMGGELTVISEVGRGSAFVVRLPAAEEIQQVEDRTLSDRR
jgi:signal transduction histidine kinase